MTTPDTATPAPTDLTWTMLLAHWTAFAQSSLALPKTDEGDRFRAAVPAIIGLQAITLALNDIDRLPATSDPEGERALGVDKSTILIRQYAGDLNLIFKGVPLHPEVAVLIDDARTALKTARHSGWEWRVDTDRLAAEHPAELIALVLSTGFHGDLFIASPGIDVFREAPAAFCRQPDGGRPSERVIRAIKEFLIDVGRPERTPQMRQVYRQFDFAAGAAVRDLVAPMDAELPAGQPLLVPAIVEGRAVRVTLPPRRGPQMPAVPVVFAETESPR